LFIGPIFVLNHFKYIKIWLNVSGLFTIMFTLQALNVQNKIFTIIEQVPIYSFSAPAANITS